jgi:hypothetical protein
MAFCTTAHVAVVEERNEQRTEAPILDVRQGGGRFGAAGRRAVSRIGNELSKSVVGGGDVRPASPNWRAQWRR